MTIFLIILLILLAIVMFGSQKKEPIPPKKDDIPKRPIKPEKIPANLKKQPLTQEDINYQKYLKNFQAIDNSLKLSPIRTMVAGVRYANEKTGVERQLIIRLLKPNEKLMLIPEENNPHDPNAVMVLRLNGDQIGYLNLDLALEIKARLVEGLLVEASVKEILKKDGILEVVIELVKYSRKKSS